MNHEIKTHLDLFSGIGGFALAARNCGYRTVAFCEIDPYCQRVLRKNFGATLADSQRDGQPGAKEPAGAGGGQDQGGLLQPEGHDDPPRLIPDIHDLNGADFRGVDLLTGGFPCQPFSHAGQRRGSSDDRALWPEMFRVIGEARPAFVIGENVSGFISMELDRCISDMEGIGYATRAFVIPACAVGAFHRRDRVWIIGRGIDSNGSGTGLEGSCATGDTGSERAWGAEQSTRLRGGCRWEPEPGICRVVNGVRNRVDRLRGLGNSVVPALVEEILRIIVDSDM